MQSSSSAPSSAPCSAPSSAPCSAPPSSAPPKPERGIKRAVGAVEDFWSNSRQDRLLGGNCRSKPLGCLQQLVIGTVAIALAWTAIAWFVDSKPPSMFKLLKFAVIFLPVSFFLRWLDVEIQDKISIAAGMTLGNKMVQILTL